MKRVVLTMSVLVALCGAQPGAMAFENLPEGQVSNGSTPPRIVAQTSADDLATDDAETADIASCDPAVDAEAGSAATSTAGCGN